MNHNLTWKIVIRLIDSDGDIFKYSYAQLICHDTLSYHLLEYLFDMKRFLSNIKDIDLIEIIKNKYEIQFKMELIDEFGDNWWISDSVHRGFYRK